MSGGDARPPVAAVEDLLAHAYAMEREAAERYADLAEQMRQHNNPEVASLFERMAEIEGMHAAQVGHRLAGNAPAHRAPWRYAWSDPEAPETTPFESAHYLMTPHQALTLALEAERRALRFYESILQAAPDGPLHDMAAEFAEEEREHVQLVQQWLGRFAAPDGPWDHDPDPARGQ